MIRLIFCQIMVSPRARRAFLVPHPDLLFDLWFGLAWKNNIGAPDNTAVVGSLTLFGLILCPQWL